MQLDTVALAARLRVSQKYGVNSNSLVAVTA